MRKLTVICLLYFNVFNLFSQTKDENYFSPQPESFIQQLKTLFKQYDNEKLNDMLVVMEKKFKNKEISEDQLGRMVDVMNIIHKKKMPTNPILKNFLEAAIEAKNSGYTDDFIDRWYNYNKGILNNLKQGSSKEFTNFVDFSKDLFMFNALVSNKSKTYKIDSKDGVFSSSNGKTYFKVPNTTLKGYYMIDTVFIRNTSGVYNITDGTWEGYKGTMDWKKAGIPKEVASATIGKYTIDMNKPDIFIDSALLSYKEIFPTPIYGRLIEKIEKDNDSTKTNYPQFISYNNYFEFKNVISDNVQCRGGFALKGNKVYMNSDMNSKVIVDIYSKGNVKKLLTAYSNAAIFEKGKFVSMQKAHVTLYEDKDSITHPYCQLNYKVADRSIKIVREEYGVGKSRFKSSFHSMFFDAEMIDWKIDENDLILNMLSGKGKNAAKFISDRNFDQNTYSLARTAAGTGDPLSVLSKMSETLTAGIPIEDFAKRLGAAMSKEAVLPFLYTLEKEGFLSLDPTSNMININSEFIKFYLQANNKRTDYDIIRFGGYGKKAVGRYNIKEGQLYINSVRRIPFNDSTEVYAFPFDTSIVQVGKNRNINYDGKMFVGRMDLYGSKFSFNYDSFNVKSPKIDIMKINIPSGEKDKQTDKDLLMPLQSQIEKLAGTITINTRFNRSGMTSIKQYPIINSKNNSFVYYDQSSVWAGAYPRDSFYFEVFPFTKDSLLHFEPKALNFPGKFLSAGIFNEFKESLRIQKDNSLGFTTQTPASGFNTYRGRGIFKGTANLSNQGLVGKGEQTHLTASMVSDSILYFPDQTSMLANKFSTTKKAGGVEYAQSNADSANVAWKPYADTMLVESKKNKPFSMYDQSTDMHGLLVLTSKGMFGKGFLDFNEAKISSSQMVFKSTKMTADTASMEIKSLGNKITFKTPNVRASMDFVTKIGDFKSNEKDISTDFAYNQYKAFVNEFKWDINKKVLTFRSPEGSDGSLFQSTHPLQDSLKFLAKVAEYNLVTSIIKMQGVDEIRIADSRVMPDSGRVVVFPEAKMQTLKNAVIEGDTTNVFHSITKATLEISGKNDMIGFGEYVLKVNNKDYPIKLHSIKVVKQISGKDKKNKPLFNHTIQGTGKVEKSQGLKIYKNVDFFGDVSIFMNRQFPFFSGQQRIEFKNPPYKSPWFEVNNEINVDEFYLVKKTLIAENQDSLYTGIVVDRTNFSGLYTPIMAPLKGADDQICMDARGVIKHNASLNQYEFGDSARNAKASTTGIAMSYNDSSGVVRFKGKFNPMLKIGGIPIVLAGDIENNLAESSYNFKVSAGLVLTMDPKVIQTFANLLVQEIGQNKDINYSKKDVKESFNELFYPKDVIKFDQEIASSSTIMSVPKYSPFNLVLTNLDLTFDKDDIAYRSKGEIGVALCAGSMVNKFANGYFEMGYGEYQDYFNLYLKAKSGEWFFINFSDGVLGMLSSNDNFNVLFNSLDVKKRTIKKSEKEYYRFDIASSYDADNFVKRMKNGGKYSQEEKKEAFQEEKLNIKENDLENAENFKESTPSLKEMELENARQDSLIKVAEEQLIKEEQQLLEEEKKKDEESRKLQNQIEENNKKEIAEPREINEGSPDYVPPVENQETPSPSPNEVKETPVQPSTPEETSPTPKESLDPAEPSPPAEEPAPNETPGTIREEDSKKEIKKDPAKEGALFDKYF
jgi:hypothetical protein